VLISRPRAGQKFVFMGAREPSDALAARKCQRAEVFNNAVDASEGIQRLLEAIGV
jgi:hypothetical protein